MEFALVGNALKAGIQKNRNKIKTGYTREITQDRILFQ